jgi:hypothetical protein
LVPKERAVLTISLSFHGPKGKGFRAGAVTRPTAGGRPLSSSWAEGKGAPRAVVFPDVRIDFAVIYTQAAGRAGAWL